MLDIILGTIWVHLDFYWWLNQTLCVGYLQNKFGVQLVIDQWFNQTLCVIYFTKWIWGAFANWPAIKLDTLCLIFYTVYLVHLVIDQWLNQTLCVSYFTEFVSGEFCIGPLFWVHLVIDQWIKQTLCVRFFTGYHLVPFGNWPLIKPDTMC